MGDLPDSQMGRPLLPEPYYAILMGVASVVFLAFALVFAFLVFRHDRRAAHRQPTSPEHVCAGCEETIDDMSLLICDDEAWHRDCLIPQIDEERDSLLAHYVEDYRDMATDALVSLAMRRVFHDDWQTQVRVWRVLRVDSQPDREELNKTFFVEADDHTVDEVFVIGAILADSQTRHDLLVAALIYGDSVELTDDLREDEAA